MRVKVPMLVKVPARVKLPSSPTELRQAIERAPRNAGRGLIWLYRHTLSPLVGYHCRHLPTCSVYGDEAIGRFGLWAGGWMTLARLLRCNPYGTSGIDNVPAIAPPGAHWYLPWRYARWRGVNAPAAAHEPCGCGRSGNGNVAPD